MIIPFGAAADLLQPRSIDATQPDPPAEILALARNAVHGSLYEMHWREPFHTASTEMLDSAKRRAIKRLRALPAEAEATPCTVPLVLPSTPGWGTYKWKYDPKLPQEAVGMGAPIIDTAETYGYGRCEKQLGEALEKKTFEHTLIATKVSRNHMGHANVLRAASRSAYALGNPLGLYQIHWPNPNEPIEGTMEAFNELLGIDIVRWVGVCNFSVDQFYRARQTCPRLASIQVRVEGLAGVLPYYQAMKIAVIAHSPLGQGRDVLVRKSVFQWCYENCVTPIVGTNNIEHLRENLTR